MVDMVLIAINGSSILSMGQREVRSSSYNEGVRYAVDAEPLGACLRLQVLVAMQSVNRARRVLTFALPPKSPPAAPGKRLSDPHLLPPANSGVAGRRQSLESSKPATAAPPVGGGSTSQVRRSSFLSKEVLVGLVAGEDEDEDEEEDEDTVSLAPSIQMQSSALTAHTACEHCSVAAGRRLFLDASKAS